VTLDSTGAINTANAGTYAIIPSNAVFSVGLASNYTISYVNGTLTVNPYAVSMTGTRVYDGTVNAAASIFTLGPLVGTETLTLSGTGTVASKDVGTGKVVTLGTLTLGNGTGLASNYTFIGGTQAASITPATLTAAVINTPAKVYNGTTTATLAPANYALTGFIGTEGATVTQTVGSYNSKDVVTANTVSVTLVATDYTATGATLLSNYILPTAANGAGTITPKALTATISAPNKVYDGNTTAAPTFSITGGLIGIETVTATGTATFNSKDVLTANLVTANSTLLANGTNGGLASNYSLVAGQTVAAYITPKALTAAITAPDKVYDGALTATPTFTIIGGLVGIETVTATGTATFNSKDVQTANLVTANSNVLANGSNGGLASNYSLVTGQTVAAFITPKSLTAAVINTPTKVYDGTTVATLVPTNYALTGLVGTEGMTVTQTFGSYNSKDVVTANTVSVTLALANYTPNTGTLLSNYTLPVAASGAGTITPKLLAAAVINTPTKVYDGNTVATLVSANYALTGLVGTEGMTVTQTVGSYNSKDVVTANTVSVTLAATDFTANTGTLLSNYTLPTLNPITGAGNITPKLLTAAVINTPSKVYDGNTTATLASTNYALTGFVTGDGATVTQSVGAYNSKDVVTATTVSVTLAATDFTATGTTLLSNYTLPTLDPTTGAGKINPFIVSMTGARVYDGTTSAAANIFTPPSGSLGTLVLTETLTLAGTGAVSSPNVGTYTVTPPALGTLTLGTLTLGNGTNGGLASNYTFIGGTQTATINPAILTAVVIGTPTKVYNGTTVATLASTNYSITGFITGEGATITKTVGTYYTDTTLATTTKDVVTATTVNVTLASTDFTATGTTLLSNYTLPVAATGAGTITPKALTATITAPDKVYDGAITAAPTFTITGGLIGIETVIATGTATFNSKDVLTANLVTADSTLLANGANGGLASNYSLVAGQTVTAKITPAPLDVAANMASITYGDDTVTGSPFVTYAQKLQNILDPAAFTATGLVTGETIGSVTLTHDAGAVPNVGSYLIAPSNANFSNGDASNYDISYLNGQLTVNPKEVTVFASRPYDTTIDMKADTVGSVFGVYLNGVRQDLTLTGTGYLLDKNAGYGKPVTLGTLTLGNGPKGELSSNYTLVRAQANINQASLVVNGLTAQNKIYDATTAATLTGTATITPLGSDSVTLNTGTGAAVFNSKNVGNNIIVTLTSYALTGPDAANYTIQSNQLQANIIRKNISFTGTPVAVSREYDGTTLTTISGVTVNGLITGDAASLVGIFTSPNVGVNKFASLALTGASAANYSYTGTSLTASIFPRALTYTGAPVAASRVYDGTLTTSVSGIILSGALDNISVTGLFADKNVGNGKAVTFAVSGANAGNYSISLPGSIANITALALTLSGTPVAASRMYDSTRIAAITGASLVGVVSGDSLVLSGLFADPDVGTAKPVTLALTGRDVGNYSISLPAGLTANITVRTLVVTANNQIMNFGGPIPSLTYTVGGAGLVGTDSKSTVFTGLLAVNTTGVYPGFTAPITQGTLVLTVGPGGNYIISSFVDGTMTVQ
ncbi:MAG TPA: YDG domain-containing protein, partial [Gallionella sp.]